MTPEQLFEQPYCKEVQNYLSACLLSHYQTGQDIGQLIGTTNTGYSCQQARTEYIRKRRGNILYGIYCELLESYDHRAASRILFDWLNGQRMAPEPFTDEVDEARLLSAMVNAKSTSYDAFEKRLAHVAREVATLILMPE